MKLRSKVSLLLVVLTLISVSSIAYFQFRFTAQSYSKEIDNSLYTASRSFVSRINELDQLKLAKEKYKVAAELEGQASNNAEDETSKNKTDKPSVAPSPTTLTPLGGGMIDDSYSFRFDRNYSQIDIEVFTLTGELLVTPSSGAVKLTPEMLNVFKTQKSKIINLNIDGEHHRILVALINEEQAAIFVRSYKEFDLFQENNFRFSFLALLITLLLAGLAGMLLGTRVTKNIEYVTKRSRLIAQDNDYTLRFDDSLKDEAGVLAKLLNLILNNLAQSKAEQQRMIENANHELKTPLTSMITNLTLLKKREQLSEQDVEEIIEELNAEAKELSSLVNELITLSRGDEINASPEHFEVESRVRQLTEKITFRTNRAYLVSGADFELLYTPEEFDRVMSNVLENANKFDPTDLPIEVNLGDGYIEVVDHGPGFSAEDLKHGTERFYRGSQAQYVEGSGLGLSIVESIIVKNKGRLELSNRDSAQGACVRIYFN